MLDALMLEGSHDRASPVMRALIMSTYVASAAIRNMVITTRDSVPVAVCNLFCQNEEKDGIMSSVETRQKVKCFLDLAGGLGEIAS